MKFDYLVGQHELKRRFVEQIDNNRVSHAQLFCGKQGYGTLALAVAYVQYLFCEHRHDGDSCGECPSCKMVDMLQHPDLHLVFPVNKRDKKAGEVVTSDMFVDKWSRLCFEKGAMFDIDEWYDRLDLGPTMKGIISAKESENIIKKLSLKSFMAEYKVVLIWLPEAMNIEAANKLLKVLEEPWDKTLFILVTEHPEQLLPTIVSRTQQVVVPPIEYAEMVGLANASGAEGEEANAIARLSQGSILEFEKVIKGMDKEANRDFFDQFRTLMRLCYSSDHLKLMAWVDEMLTHTRECMCQFFMHAERLFRESYMLHLGVQEVSYVWGEEADFCRKFAPYIDSKNIERLIAETEQALYQVSHNGAPRIVFTHYALTVSKMINNISPKGNS
ncbi:MAG: DNA polymerase III subunit delta [Alistipes sp.]|nr:DNA polymerase III subunit delta [Alistipes sp.]